MITCNPAQAAKIRLGVRSFRVFRFHYYRLKALGEHRGANAFAEQMIVIRRKLLVLTSQFELVPNDYQATLPK